MTVEREMSKKRRPSVDEAYDRRYRNDPGPESRDLSMEEVTIFAAARETRMALCNTSALCYKRQASKQEVACKAAVAATDLARVLSPGRRCAAYA